MNPPYFLRRCAEILRGSTVKASTTIGFPHGGHTHAIKIAEARQAVADGGQELDVVVNISAVLSGAWGYVREELADIIGVTHEAGQKVKIIFENCYLTNEQKVRLCEICGELGADWVKTSTGYGSGGATMEDLALMRAHSPAHVAVKAAGGVRDLDALLRVREIGVSRVGATEPPPCWTKPEYGWGLRPSARRRVRLRQGIEMRVVVFGRSGQLGRELVQVFRNRGHGSRLSTRQM